MKWIGLIALTAACTTLGPIPTTTQVSAVPAGRPSVEGQIGATPSYYLSSSVADAKGSSTGAGSILFEPDRYFHTKGLVLGGRLFGKGKDTLVEPLVGFRKAFGDDFSVGAVVFGTSKRATSRLASYHGFHVGGEVAADGRIGQLTRWLGLHVQGALQVTRVVASGQYCVNDEGKGADCSEDDPDTNQFVLGRMRGTYPTGTAAVALDFGRFANAGYFHNARLAVRFSGGLMPTATNGVQGNSQAFFAGGLDLTLGFGAK